MKLKNKLIPILSVLTTSSLIAPLSTSCSTTTSTQESSMIDVLHGYQPGTKKAELAEGLTVDQITDNYVAAIKSNPDLLRQDLAWYEGKALPYRMSNAASTFSNDLGSDYYLEVTQDTSGSYQILGIPKVAKFGLSNISINQEEIVNPSTHNKEKVYTVSMNVDYEYSYDVVGLAQERYGEYKPYSVLRTYTNKFSATYSNLPFRVTRNSVSLSGGSFDPLGLNIGMDPNEQTYTGLWGFQLIGWQDRFNWMLEAIPKWSYTVDASQVTVDKLTDLDGNVKTYTYDDSFAATIKDMSTLDAFLNDVDDESSLTPYILNFGSLYLYDVYAPKWWIENMGYSSTVNGNPNDNESLWNSPIMIYIAGMQLNSTSAEIEAGKYPNTDSTHKFVITTDKNLPSKEVPSTGETQKFYPLPIINTETKEQLLEVQIPVETIAYAKQSGAGVYNPSIRAYIDINHEIDPETQSELYEKAKDFLDDFYNKLDWNQTTLPTFFADNNLQFTLPKSETGTTFKFVFTAANTELGTYDEVFELSESITYPWTDIQWHSLIRV